MNKEEKQIRKAIKGLVDKGYAVRVIYDYSGIDIDTITGGDCNCPCRKYYDPKDGHGFTLLYMDDFIDMDGTEANYTINILQRMIKHLEKIEGQPLPIKD